MTGDSSQGRSHATRPAAGGLRRNLRRFVASEAGSTTIEYGLIVALIALMLVSFLHSFSDKLSGFFLSLAGAIRTS